MLSAAVDFVAEETMSKDAQSPAQAPLLPPVAYRSDRFMESADARTIRIAAEYIEPQLRLKRAGIQNTVVFFGSARIWSRQEALRRMSELDIRGSNGAGAPPTTAELKAARQALQMSRYYEDARELARLITRWSLSLGHKSQFVVVCSGGGPGIMEAANRGASEAGGKSIGFNIKLPNEQAPNPYITPELNFTFRYFFMRKLWFAQPARALIVFPGGFGTMDELWEFLTLIQTHKIGHRATILLYGSKFWKSAINFNLLRDVGTISGDDLNVLHFADSPAQAFEILKKKLKRDRRVRAAIRHPFP
jgi:uncharacterized protein (TIGR00730 family)